MKTLTLETNQSLSNSLIWKYQMDYFAREGVSAWVEQVPFYVTSNQVIASKYAHVVATYIKEALAKQIITKKEPLYLMELGVGSGKFSFLFIQELFENLKELQIKGLDWTYIMTDFTAANVTFWKTQPQLAEWVKDGFVEFALFDSDHPKEINLIRQNQPLQDLTNPLIVIANYLFDTISHDLFKVENGQLYEGQITLKTPDYNYNEAEETVYALKDLEVTYSYHPTDSKYYPLDHWNAVLSDYMNTLDTGYFTVPTGAFRAMDYLNSLSKKGAVVLAGDKGYTRRENYQSVQDTHIAFHGSFSLMVNFDAIATYCRVSGGDACLTRDGFGLKTNLFLTRDQFKKFSETGWVFNKIIKAFNSEDFLKIKNAVLNASSLSLLEYLALLKLSRWDAYLFTALSEKFIEQLSHVTLQQRLLIKEGLLDLKRSYYHLPNSKDVFFEVGRVYYAISEFKLALAAYNESNALFKYNDAPYYYNVGLCYYYLGDTNKAVSLFKEALADNPEFEQAQQWIDQIEGNISEDPLINLE